MANICMVSVKITGPKSQIQTLETELQTAANNTYYKKIGLATFGCILVTPSPMS